MTRIAARSAATLAPRRDGARLTPQERLERGLSETAFADQVLDLARVLGWRSLHIRPARTKHGWVTPVAGDGRGFPDLLLARARDRRLVFAELKREVGGELRPDQQAWLDELGGIVPLVPFDPPWIEVHVWRPSDLRDPIADSVIGQVLR